jgi:hypothetical protein
MDLNKFYEALILTRNYLELMAFFICTCQPGTKQSSRKNQYKFGRQYVHTIKDGMPKYSGHHNGLLYERLDQWTNKLNDETLVDGLLSTLDDWFSFAPQGFHAAVYEAAAIKKTRPLNTLLRKLKSKTSQSGNVFDKRIRPALRELYLGRNDPWIRHGQEHKRTINKGELFPVPKTYFEPIPGYYCIELGSPPLKYCILHGNQFQPWGVLNTTKHEGQVKHAKWRDHLAANHLAPVENWIFVFDRSDFKKEDISLLANGKGAVSVAVTNTFLEIAISYRNIFRAYGYWQD